MMMKVTALLVNLILICSIHSQEILQIQTPDKCIIHSEVKITTNTKFILFQIHGLGSSKEEWNEINKAIEEKENIGYVSLDLRGHGKSKNCKDREIKYPNLTQTDIASFLKDVDSVYNYIKEKYPSAEIIPIGASIGANIAMSYFYKKVKKIILLSPGLNYAGYEIADFFKKTKAKILLITSQTDIYSLNSTRIFMEILNIQKRKYSLILAKSGHGVEIFKNNEKNEYLKNILQWIKS